MTLSKLLTSNKTAPKFIYSISSYLFHFRLKASKAYENAGDSLALLCGK